MDTKLDRYENSRDIQAKVATINIMGDNSKHSKKSLRWVLRDNSHIKKIEEIFENRNLWYTILFDCEKRFKEAKRKLENAKEEYEKCRLILSEEFVA
jgi:tRNA A22 N-methylase